MIERLIEACQFKLKEKLTDFNSVDMLMLSETYNFPFLRQLCIDYISIRYDQVNSLKNFESFLQRLPDDLRMELYTEIASAKQKNFYIICTLNSKTKNPVTGKYSIQGGE